MLTKHLNAALRSPIATASSSHSTQTQLRGLKGAVLHVRTALSSLLVWLLLCHLVLPMQYRQVQAQVTHNLNLIGGAVNPGWFTPVAKSLVSAQTGDAITVFGPRRFVRTTGQPNQYVEHFSLPAGLSAPSRCTLQVQNGGVDGSQRVSSATVKHNGTAIFTPGDLNQNVGSLNRTIVLTSNNQLDVTLSSKPGSYLIITITCVVSDTTLPSVVITDPPTNITTTASQITISGTANDSGVGASGIAHVYVNDVEAPYNVSAGTWIMPNLPLILGANQVTARALDQAGNEATVAITITREVPNQPPTVDAGLDQTLTLPNTANLDGTASDDGLPQGSNLSTVWTVVSGPGVVTFANASDVDTTATFSDTGVYVLRLTASDSEFTVSDDLQITVPTLCEAGDNFDDNAIDLAKWIQPGSNAVTVEEKNQRLEISPSLTATGYNGYVSAISCDLTNRRVSVEVVQITNNVCGTETYFTLKDASNPRNLIFVASGCDSLAFFYYVNGVGSFVTRIYDPAQYRFWRISHNGATNTISWETSPDRLNWTVQRSLVSQFPLSNMTTELQAGTYAVVNPGKAIFDDLRYEEFSAAATSSIRITSPANVATFLAPKSFQITRNSITTNSTAAKPQKQSRFLCKL